ncbi:putative uncharacterized protein [Pseudomonas sp. StFLB209]|nr:putative uncharacterized protein [Pseudomonas sp. StFLB209]
MRIGVIQMDQNRASPLRKLNGFWRVDGISEVHPAEKGLKIGFVLSRLRDDYTDPNDGSARLDMAPELLVLNPRWINDLTPGSVWENGACVSKPEWLGRSLSVDTSQAKKLPFSTATQINGKWTAKGIAAADFLPKKDYHYLFATYYTLAPVSGDAQFKWMVIPHSELFRFYSAVSGRVAKNVLRGDLGELVDLSVNTEIDPVTIVERVKLKESEAKFFGRIKASKSFADEIFKINKRITLINIENRRTGARAALALEANFPFAGQTNLSVSGVPMLLANEPAIFAMQIHHCTYPLGFSSLVVKSAGDRAGGGSPDESGKGYVGFNVPGHDPDDEDDEIADTPADADLKRVEISQVSSLFPQDAEISIEYQRSWKHTTNTASYVSEKVDIDGLTFGDGDHRASSQHMVGVDDFKDEPPPPARQLKDFFEMLHHFEKRIKDKNWLIRSVAINGSIPIDPNELENAVLFITALPMLANKKRRWHIIAEEGNVRTRQLACIEVQSARANRYFYILEVELKDNEPGQCTLLVRRRDFKKISLDDFTSLLKLTCYKNRWPDFENDTWEKSKQQALADRFSSAHVSRKLHHPKNRLGWSDSLTTSILEWLKSALPVDTNQA